MTNQEAIDILKCDISADKQGIEYCHDEVGIKALDMAIKALEQEPNGDLISRQAVIDVIKSMSNANPSYWNKCDVVDREDLIDEISELPSVKQEPKTGHWSHDGSHWKNRFICSECGYKLFDEPTNYCPNCGAKMVEPQERSDKE